MTEGLAAGASQILDLLNYIEQVEKLKAKSAFSIPTEFFVAYQHELKGLQELQFNLQVEGDDVWLRLPRLQEIAAEAFWGSALATGANRVNPFEASTFDGTLKCAVGHLDPSGA